VTACRGYIATNRLGLQLGPTRCFCATWRVCTLAPTSTLATTHSIRFRCPLRPGWTRPA
jgi:hypothetical protein